MHAATRAGAFHPAGREALLRYVLRPAVAQERVELRPNGLVRITLKKAYADGTIAVDMDPLTWPRWARRPICPPLPGARPPILNSRVLRRQAPGEEDDGPGRWVQDTA